jgi:hypothetical protein
MGPIQSTLQTIAKAAVNQVLSFVNEKLGSMMATKAIAKESSSSIENDATTGTLSFGSHPNMLIAEKEVIKKRVRAETDTAEIVHAEKKREMGHWIRNLNNDSIVGNGIKAKVPSKLTKKPHVKSMVYETKAFPFVPSRVAPLELSRRFEHAIQGMDRKGRAEATAKAIPHCAKENMGAKATSHWNTINVCHDNNMALKASTEYNVHTPIDQPKFPKYSSGSSQYGLSSKAKAATRLQNFVKRSKAMQVSPVKNECEI